MRCDLHNKLSSEKKKLTADIDKTVEGLNNEVKGLNKEREDILKKHNLLNLNGSEYRCYVASLHPDLKVFDENTNIARKRILGG